jgi:hypothetical protein
VNLHHHCTTAATVCTTDSTHAPAFVGMSNGIAQRARGVVVCGADSRRLHHLDARSASHCGRFLLRPDPHHHCTTDGQAAGRSPLSAQATNSAGTPGEGETCVH